MGVFRKPTSTNIVDIIPYIPNQPVPLIWTIADTVDGIDTVSVQSYSDSELTDAYDSFYEDSETPKVLRYAEEFDQKTFTNLDYVRGLDIRLAPKRKFINGVLTNVDYYSEVTLDPVTGMEIFTDLIVSEEYTYSRDSNGFAYSRDMDISWITEANTKHRIGKRRQKTYNLTESIRETDRRRSNVIDALKTNMIGMFVTGMDMPVTTAIQLGQNFFQKHISQIVLFKEIGEVQELIDSINEDTVNSSWLDAIISEPDVTMRMFITSSLSAGLSVGT